MALNYNGYPAPYQTPYYQQPYYQQQQNAQQNGVIWVQGEAGAKAYLVAPNSTVQLWDSDAQVIYLKSADASGMPSMKVLDYTIRDNSTPAKEPVYATKKDIEALNDQIEAIRDEIDLLSVRKKKREVEDE